MKKGRTCVRPKSREETPTQGPRYEYRAAQFMLLCTNCNRICEIPERSESSGRPARGLHALQLEINRGLYMDEQRIDANRGFDHLAAGLQKLAGELIAAFAGAGEGLREAAE